MHITLDDFGAYIKTNFDVVDTTTTGKKRKFNHELSFANQFEKLFFAADFGQLTGCKEAVKYVKDINAHYCARRIPGDTPLHRAAKKGHVEVAKFLVSMGADATILNEHGQSPADFMPELGKGSGADRKAVEKAIYARQVREYKEYMRTASIDLVLKDLKVELASTYEFQEKVKRMSDRKITGTELLQQLKKRINEPFTCERDHDEKRITLRAMDYCLSKFA